MIKISDEELEVLQKTFEILDEKIDGAEDWEQTQLSFLISQLQDIVENSY